MFLNHTQEAKKVAKSKPEGFWKDPENAANEARRVMDQLDTDVLPSHDRLIKAGYSSLAGAILKYHGGIRTFRTYLGQDNRKARDSYWNEQTVLEEGRAVMRDNDLDYFPSQTELVKLGQRRLVLAAFKHFPGGFAALRERLGVDPDSHRDNYWTDVENVLEECRTLMEAKGYDVLPSGRVLAQIGRSDLERGIANHHGFPKIRRLLGESTATQREKGYWSNPDNITREVRELRDRLGRFPTQKDLRANGLASIANSAITHFGGLANLRKQIETEDGQQDELESLLGSYIGREQDDE